MITVFITFQKIKATFLLLFNFYLILFICILQFSPIIVTKKP